MLLSLTAVWLCPPNWGLQHVAEGVLLRAEKSSLAQPITACSGQLAGLACVRKRWAQPHKAKEDDAKSCLIMFQKYNCGAWTLGRLSLLEIVQEAEFTEVFWGFASPYCNQDLLSAQVFQGSESNSKMGSARICQLHRISTGNCENFLADESACLQSYAPGFESNESNAPKLEWQAALDMTIDSFIDLCVGHHHPQTRLLMCTRDKGPR